MCGRYTLVASDEQLCAEFDLIEYQPVAPNDNICPTDMAPVVRVRETDAARILSRLRWGLIPSWSSGPDSGFKMINARSEDAAVKPAFREALRRRRCLVPVSGFYEWKGEPGAPKKARKTRYLFARADRGPFALAGLWESWRPPGADPIESFTILTAPANDIVAPIHDRMPVVVGRSNYGLWLGNGDHDMTVLRDTFFTSEACARSCAWLCRAEV